MYSRWRHALTLEIPILHIHIEPSLVGIVSANGLAPFGARPSADTVLIIIVYNEVSIVIGGVKSVTDQTSEFKMSTEISPHYAC